MHSSAFRHSSSLILLIFFIIKAGYIPTGHTSRHLPHDIHGNDLVKLSSITRIAFISLVIIKSSVGILFFPSLDHPQ